MTRLASTHTGQFGILLLPHPADVLGRVGELAVHGPQFLLEGPESLHAFHPLAELDFPFGGLSDDAGPFPWRNESLDEWMTGHF